MIIWIIINLIKRRKLIAKRLFKDLDIKIGRWNWKPKTIKFYQLEIKKLDRFKNGGFKKIKSLDARKIVLTLNIIKGIFLKYLVFNRVKIESIKIIRLVYW